LLERGKEQGGVYKSKERPIKWGKVLAGEKPGSSRKLSRRKEEKGIEGKGRIAGKVGGRVLVTCPEGTAKP